MQDNQLFQSLIMNTLLLLLLQLLKDEQRLTAAKREMPGSPRDKSNFAESSEWDCGDGVANALAGQDD